MSKIFSTILLVLFFNMVQAREHIQIVGSSTVYPLSTIIAENFKNKNKQFKTPVVEATGTGGGFKLFCQGVGANTADVTNASRHIKKDEIDFCHKNGVKDIREIVLGYDAITIIHSKALGNINLSKKHLFLALAAQVPDANGNLIKNPYKQWSDIDKSLPNIGIKVLGRPSTSGTRDTFIELVMEGGIKQLQKEKLLKADINVSTLSKNIRSDGPWIEMAENDPLVITKVSQAKDLFGILGYNYYEQNKKLVVAASIDGIAPNAENLKKQTYPLFRPLYVYVKGEHFGVIPGLKEFVMEMTSKSAIGSNGYLKNKGLIALPTKEYDSMINKLNLK